MAWTWRAPFSARVSHPMVNGRMYSIMVLPWLHQRQPRSMGHPSQNCGRGSPVHSCWGGSAIPFSEDEGIGIAIGPLHDATISGPNAIHFPYAKSAGRAHGDLA